MDCPLVAWHAPWMRIANLDDLLTVLDEVIASGTRGDRTRGGAGDYWSRLLTDAEHPLSTRLPDEPLVDWHTRGLLGHLDGARVLDVGCGNGRNGAWLAGQGAEVIGVDLAAGLLGDVRPLLPPSMTVRVCDVLRDPLPGGTFDVVYDSGCYHHVAPHRRLTYLDRILSRVTPGGRFAIVTFGAAAAPDDTVVLATGDTAGGMSFTPDDLVRAFRPLTPVEVRSVREGVPGTFGAGFLNAGLFESRGGTPSSAG